MITNNFLLSFVVITVIGAIVSSINFIPTWENTELITIVSLFLIAAIVGLICFVRQWISIVKAKNSLKHTDWLKSLLFSVIIIFGFSFLFFISVLSVGPGPFRPLLEKEKVREISGTKIYLFRNSCFPPDGFCECDDYYSLIYIKNRYLPVMHFKKEVNFYVGDIRLKNDRLIIKASGDCEIDLGKMSEIEL